MDWNLIIQYALLALCFAAIAVWLWRRMRNRGKNAAGGCDCGCGCGKSCRDLNAKQRACDAQNVKHS
jgi:hypothetical protein